MRTRPDILVLGAGGLLGEAWMAGVLAGIEDAADLDLGRCEHFVGTSGGVDRRRAPVRPVSRSSARRRARPSRPQQAGEPDGPDADGASAPGDAG